MSPAAEQVSGAESSSGGLDSVEMDRCRHYLLLLHTNDDHEKTFARAVYIAILLKIISQFRQR
jgi:hypothetical protein